MAPRTLILLPPSEGKAPGGRGPAWRPGTMSLGELDAARAQLLAALGPDHPAAQGRTRRAVDRYTGVLYRELGPSTLTAAGKRRLHRSTLIASGLWGLVATTDPIPDYKLKMSVAVDPLGRLSTWWRPHLAAALAPRVQGVVVWDLLPAEHAAAVHWPALEPRRRITVRFLDRRGATVSHWNKLLKGSIVRWLVESGETAPEALADLDHPQDYRFDLDASDLGPRRAEVVLRQPR